MNHISFESQIRRLSADNAFIRKIAAQALGRQRIGSAVPFLQRALLEEEDPKTAKWMGLALAQIGMPGSSAFLDLKLKKMTDEDTRDWIIVSKSMLVEEATGRIENIRHLLQSKSTQTLREGVSIAWGLKKIPDDIVKLLIKKVNHSDPDIRRWSILSLGETLGFSSAVTILDSLNDSDYLVREWAECTLAKIRDPIAYPYLFERLNDAHPRVREWAIKAIASYDNMDTSNLLISNFTNEKDEFCREGTIRALQNRTDDPIVKNFLIEQINSASSKIVQFASIDVLATSSVAKSDPEIIENLIDLNSSDLDESTHIQVASTLIESCSPYELNMMSSFLGSRKLNRIHEMLTEGKKGYSTTTANYYLDKVLSFKSSTQPTGVIQNMKDNNQTKIDVGIVVALKEEFREFYEQLNDKAVKTIEDPSTAENYYCFEYSESSEQVPYKCVSVLVGEMGPTKAALTTDRLLNKWSPSTIVILGIAAGIHKDLKIGDVIIANQVDNYLERAKAVESEDGDNRFDFELSGEVFRGSHDIIQNIRNFEFTHPELFIDWRKNCKLMLDTLLSRQAIDQLIEKQIIRENVQLEDVHLASGPVVGASVDFIKWLHGRDRAYKALEMESGGVLAAIYSRVNPKRALVIRGISDFGDQSKTHLDNIQGGSLRKYAMHNATNLLWSILKAHILPIG